jgi:hypothetical protein
VTAYRRFRQARRIVGDFRFAWWAIASVAGALAWWFA